MSPIDNLDALFSAMLEGDPRVVDEHGQFRSDLPSFGGREPADTVGVWSWDTTRIVVGHCADDLEIVERDEG